MRSLVERLERVQVWLTFGFVSVITVCVSLQVFVRYILQRPLFLWTEELARFILIWMVFLGIGVGVKNDAHFAMDVLPSLLGRRWGAVVRLFNDLFMGTILILLILAGLWFSWFGMFQNSPNMEILMVWVFISIPLGGVLSLIYLVERIQQRLRDVRGDAQ
jgi:TRAP-type transport system small permease protein